MIPQFSSWVHCNKNVGFWSPKRMYWNVHGNTFHNSPQTETTQITSTSRMDKHILKGTCSVLSGLCKCRSQSAEKTMSTCCAIPSVRREIQNKQSWGRGEKPGSQLLSEESGAVTAPWGVRPGLCLHQCANSVRSFQAVHLVCILFLKCVTF